MNSDQALMDDGELYGTNRDGFDPVEDIAVMPYSSGTTGTTASSIVPFLSLRVPG